MRDAARLSMDPAKMARCFKDDGWRVMTGAEYETLCTGGALPEWCRAGLGAVLSPPGGLSKWKGGERG